MSTATITPHTHFRCSFGRFTAPHARGRPAVTPTLHVHRVGAGEPLVLLHGLGESHIGWRPVIDALSEEYDVIAIDLPGFGRSPALPGSVSPTAVNLAAAVERHPGRSRDRRLPRRRVLPRRPGRDPTGRVRPGPVAHRDRPGRPGHPGGTPPGIHRHARRPRRRDGPGTGRRLVPGRPVAVLRRHPQPALAARSRRRQAAAHRLRRLTRLRRDELGVAVRHAHPPAHHHPTDAVPAGHRRPVDGPADRPVRGPHPRRETDLPARPEPRPDLRRPHTGRPPHADVPRPDRIRHVPAH